MPSEQSEQVRRQQAFEDLAATVYEPLQRYLLRRVDEATAQDVLADVLLVLWRRLADVPPDAALPWSYGVARRCLANSLRATERQDHLVRKLASVRQGEPVADEAFADLHEALAFLSIDDRELLWLSAWEQLAPREIAVVLGCTANAASIRLHRAGKRLRRALDSGAALDSGGGKDPGPSGHLGKRHRREAAR